MFNYELFKNTNDVNFVSISRSKCHNNKDLLKLINDGNIKEAHIDTLDTELRDELLSTNIFENYFYKFFVKNRVLWIFINFYLFYP